MAQRLLITGGAGFIGINAAYYFLAQGWEVTIADNFSRRGSEHNAEELLKVSGTAATLLKLDLRTDTAALAQAVAAHDAVLHLAAQVAVTTSVTDPTTDFMINALGTFNVLEAIRLSPNRPPIIYSSTNKVYGGLEARPVVEAETRYQFAESNCQQFGIPETEQLDFHSPYGCSKGAADQYVRDYARIYGLKTLVFRQSCIYGPHQFGIEDQGWVAWFMIAASQERPVTIYGTGKQVRDLLFAGDLVRLYEKGFQRIDAVSGNVYNAGGGPNNTLSLHELLPQIEKFSGRPLTISYDSMRTGDQPIFVADIRKVKQDLEWEPTTSIAEGLVQLWQWINEQAPLISKMLK
ncbi:MAG: GDP-mannose 4,6-dehydratase [Candidatus Buchananbacteria bacterium]|nr:GDP-mannose 4,6-dehydratase [Candidatus Buchananbacteria bacterium]